MIVKCGELSSFKLSVLVNARVVSSQEMTSHLLDYQTRSERLKEESGEIYPIHKRRDTPEQPIKVKALVNYKNDEVSRADIFFQFKMVSKTYGTFLVMRIR